MSATRAWRRGSRWMVGWLMVAVGAVLVAAPAEAEAGGRWEPVEGRWEGSTAPIPTDAPSAEHFTIVGAFAFDGTLTGSSYATWEYECDLSDLSNLSCYGTGEETLVAVDDQGRTGTLTWFEEGTVTGDLAGTTNVSLTWKIVDATGDFLGAQGRGTVHGVAVGTAATGTYHGRWKLPSP